MSDHSASIAQLCRVCGQRFGRDARQYSCDTYKERLQAAFQINIDKDDVLVHPRNFCIKCYLVMTRLEKNAQCRSQRVAVDWNPHTEPCPVCSSCDKQKMGGRPLTSKYDAKEPSATQNAQEGSALSQASQHLPEAVITLATITSRIQDIAPQPQNPNRHELLSTSRFTKLNSPFKLQAFTCRLCSGVLDSPIELECRHLFCSKCLIDHIRESAVASCPTCYNPISTLQHITRPSEITLMSLATLPVRCSKGQCQQCVSLGSLQKHTESCLGVNQLSKKSVHKPALAESTLADVLSAPVTKTPNTAEKTAATHIVRRLMNSTSEMASDDFLSLKTRGQVCSQ